MIESSEDIDGQKPLQRNLRDLLMQVLVVVVSEVFPLVSILYGSSKASLTLLKGFLGEFFCIQGGVKGCNSLQPVKPFETYYGYMNRVCLT